MSSGKSCAWPHRGLYFFREPGEFRANRPSTYRIVRVGTHAVGAGAKSTLWGRLRTHRGGKSGAGNHRGSIFRLHVGAALLTGVPTPLLSWGVGSNASRVVKDSERDHEKLVSSYLGRMRVLWLAIPDEPGPTSHRAVIERNSIAMLSNNLKPLDPPSASWIGRRSTRPEIASSGLWNLNYVRDRYDPGFLDLFEQYVGATVR